MFLSLLKKRRSIRKFQNKKIDPEIINKLCKAVLWAPSSRGTNPWEFIIITEKTLLASLSQAKQGARFLKKAPLAFVIIADPDKSDVWIEDSSIVSAILLFTAQDLGLGACWVQIRNRYYKKDITSEEYVAKILKIPGSYKVESIIGLGYPDEKKPEHIEVELNPEKIHYGYF